MNLFIFNTMLGIARAQGAAAEAGSIERGAQGVQCAPRVIRINFRLADHRYSTRLCLPARPAAGRTGSSEETGMFTNILLPTDGSDLATKAVDAGIELA
jgi:hypothetical protein